MTGRIRAIRVPSLENVKKTNVDDDAGGHGQFFTSARRVGSRGV